MITLKPIASRLLMLAALSLFLVMCATRNTQDNQDTEDTQGTDTIVHVSNSRSISPELAECDSDNPDPLEKEYCAGLIEMEGAIKLCEGAPDPTKPCPAFMLMTTRIEPPIVCPRGHCIPFLQIHRVRFFSEKVNGPVEIFVNNKRIGTAKDVSYDSKAKQRTVFYDLEKNFKDTKGQGQNVMTARFPVTYLESGKNVESTLVVNAQF